MEQNPVRTIASNAMQLNFNCGVLSDYRHRPVPQYLAFFEHIRHPHRFDYHVWFLITQGRLKYMVDFKLVEVQAGEAVFIQRHQMLAVLNEYEDFDCLFISWRDEFLQQNIELRGLPTVQRVAETEKVHLEAGFRLLQTGLDMADGALRKRFLQAQLSAFLMYLQSAFGQSEARTLSVGQRRFQAFGELLEQHFRQHHQVQFYAAELSCSPKTLNLCCREQGGHGAKTTIDERLILEAKRLLVHTSWSVNAVADYLGFSEGTHFAKFFKHYVGTTAHAFRKQFGLLYGEE